MRTVEFHALADDLAWNNFGGCCALRDLAGAIFPYLPDAMVQQMVISGSLVDKLRRSLTRPNVDKSDPAFGLPMWASVGTSYSTAGGAVTLARHVYKHRSLWTPQDYGFVVERLDGLQRAIRNRSRREREYFRRVFGVELQRSIQRQRSA